MKLFVLFFSLLLFVSPSVAQTNVQEICGYKTELDRVLKRQPNYLILQNALFEQAMQEFKSLSNAKRRIEADTLYFEIPVVFHVLYNKTAENLNDTSILSQLKELNNAFRKRNKDTTRIRTIFKPIAADVKIQFVLANKDPQGNASSGITRTYTNKTTFAANQFGTYTTNMKYSANGGKDAWDPTSYLNIWICNMEFPNYVGIVYGFATPPTNAPNWNGTGATKDTNSMESGVVLHYKIVGRSNPLAPVKYIEGKAAIHEVGHYLGLRHVWGDGNNTTGCNVDDGIFDTPNCKAQNATCTGQNTCTDASNDKPDQTENYMDYALDGCAGMFTQQQAFMMRFVLDKLRTGLPYRVVKYDTIPEPAAPLNGFKLYPNPLKEGQNFNVQIPGQNNEYYATSIVDACGKEVYQRTLLANKIHSIETAGLAQAIYFIVVRNAEGKIVFRQKLLIL
jgi:hypothetical protein